MKSEKVSKELELSLQMNDQSRSLAAGPEIGILNKIGSERVFSANSLILIG